MDVKETIHRGDVGELRRLLAAQPSLADALIRWGENDRLETHPLHYVSDVLFTGKLSQSAALELALALIQAGADLNFQRHGRGDTPLIGAASLGAEAVGIALLDAGARAEIRGLFGETALHWAAMLGEDRLTARLASAVGAEVNRKDEKYQSTPLGWAIFGWSKPQGGDRGRHLEVVEILVAAGAAVNPEWLQSERVRADAAMLAALEGKRIA